MSKFEDEHFGATEQDVIDSLVKKLERELGETRDQGIRFRQALNYVTTYSKREDWPEEVIDAITEAGECEVANE